MAMYDYADHDDDAPEPTCCDDVIGGWDEDCACSCHAGRERWLSPYAVAVLIREYARERD